MIAIVCGGRSYHDRSKVFEVLDQQNPTVIRHGSCTGADRLADEWALIRGGVEVVRYPADWKQYGPGAGPRRNRQMAQDGADVCIAFPGNRGTQSMIREAERRGIKCLVIE